MEVGMHNKTKTHTHSTQLKLKLLMGKFICPPSWHVHFKCGVWHGACALCIVHFACVGTRTRTGTMMMTVKKVTVTVTVAA